MNIFLKGDFKIEESWKKKPKSRSKSRQKNNHSLVQAGKNIASVGTPKGIEHMPIPDALDQQVGNYVLRQFQAQIPPPSSIKSIKSIKSQKKIPSKDQNLPPINSKHKMPSNLPQTDGDLLSSMANRLKTVQITNKSLKEELKEKSSKIDKITSENIFLKGLREDSSVLLEKMQNLESENEGLKKKVSAMEDYLKKYGLKWVGDKIQGKLQQQQLKKAIKKGNYNYRMPSQIDINTIMRRIEQLNAGLHSEGMGTELYQQNGVHKFRKAEPLPIGFFSDGIAIKGYNFSSYKSKQSLQILGDLIDGYFPSVLKHKYPNGVFLVVRDKLSQKYDAQVSSNGQKISNFDSNAQNEFKPQSKEQFLNKLPKQVVKNGKIINIRGEIQKKFNPKDNISKNQIIAQADQSQETELYQKIQGSMVVKTLTKDKLDEQLVSQEQICTLKIRNEKGDIFILHLQKYNKIKDVYTWMQKLTKLKGFHLMSNYPRRQFDQEQPQSLEELGFCPNGLLHIHPTG